jgi:amino acid adenylation domain-containing protein/non-ribosomal peptide synthase protein (TIGR01720 family)
LIDLTEHPDGERAARVADLAREEAESAFDLADGRLLRARLLRLAADENILLLTMHHIVSDGWSLGVMLRELRTAYQAHTAGGAPVFDDLPIQYADFAAWQRERLTGDHLARLSNYWRARLEGAPMVLEVPSDKPHPSVQSFRGAAHRFVIPGSLLVRLRRLGSQTGCTLFMVTLAAFAALLARYTSREDILVGVPIAGRTQRELEGLIGCFVNLLVLRIDFTGDPNVTELLSRVRKTTVEAYDYQEMPFERLLEELKVGRDLSRNPLVQITFDFQEAGPDVKIGDAAGTGLTMSPLASDTYTAKFDLSFRLVEVANELQGSVEYSTDLYEARTAVSMAGHFLTLLEGFATVTERRASELPLLTDPERRRLLTEWNDTAVPFGERVCMHHLIKAQAERTPEAVAVVCGGVGLTYYELNRRADDVAVRLRAAGVGPDRLVGVYLSRSLELVIALLGILKAGGAYLPMDPAYPEERLAFMVSDARPVALVTNGALQKRAEGVCRAGGLPASLVHCMSEDWRKDVGEEHPRSGAPPDPSNLAYVIYTSGSTGKPKGVMVEHRNVSNLFAAMDRVVPAGEGGVWLATTSVSFDIAVLEIFWPLSRGQKVVLRGPEEEEDRSVATQMLEHGVTHYQCTPTMAQLVLQDRSARAALEGLEAFLVGGEALPSALGIELASAVGGRLLNMYGPTETTVWSTAYDCRREPQDVLIGRPVANTSVYLLDLYGEPVPVGIPGEVYLGGKGVARGYLNRPDSTAERFLPDKFLPDGTGRLYRTGDLARYRPDGTLDFIGRVDQQVKLRGHRIELGEIEAVLGKYPGVRECAVLLRGGAAEPGRLVAYLVTQEGSEVSVSALRRHLQTQLPDYMLPAAYVFLDAIPLTPNGKRDTLSFPASDAFRPALANEYVPPQTPTEVLLVSLWRQVLGVDQVGIDDNFFELGGDSLKAIQVIGRAREAGINLAPRDLFRHQTVRDLVNAEHAMSPVATEQGLVTGTMPLTPIQGRFFERFSVEPHYYNTSAVLEVKEYLPPALLREALRHVTRHHDTFRLRFERDTDGWRPHLVGDKEEVFGFEALDIAPLSAEARRSVLEVVASRLHTSLDLHRGPLVRVAYLSCGTDAPGRLLLVLHHMTMDAYSWPILLSDLSAVCAALRDGREVVLPPKTTSFKRWAELMAEYADTASVRAEAEYWLGLPWGELRPIPWDLPQNRGANLRSTQRYVWRDLSPGETENLIDHGLSGREADITEALLAALATELSRWSGAAAAVEVITHARRDVLGEAVDLSRTVGWFTTHHPVVLSQPTDDDPVRSFPCVQEQLRRVPGHGLGYGLLRYCEGGQAQQDIRRLEHPEVLFHYEGKLGRQSETDESLFAKAPEPAGVNRSRRDEEDSLLRFQSHIAEDGRLRFGLAYSVLAHTGATVEAVLDGVCRYLLALAESGGTTAHANGDRTDDRRTRVMDLPAS